MAEHSLKEKFWKDGNIFQMSRGEYRMVWNNRLIDGHGYICKDNMSDYLMEYATTDDNQVIAIYPPNNKAGYLGELIKPTSPPLWTIAKHMLTLEEVKQKLGLPEDEDLYIIKK